MRGKKMHVYVARVPAVQLSPVLSLLSQPGRENLLAMVFYKWLRSYHLSQDTRMLKRVVCARP